jgi:hypothetical protein
MSIDVLMFVVALAADIVPKSGGNGQLTILQMDG